MADRDDKKKKIAAAAAGVMEFLKAEQRAATIATAAPPPFTAFTHVNVWGGSGRQAMMQMGNLMQMRAVRRFGN